MGASSRKMEGRPALTGWGGGGGTLVLGVGALEELVGIPYLLQWAAFGVAAVAAWSLFLFWLRSKWEEGGGEGEGEGGHSR